MICKSNHCDLYIIVYNLIYILYKILQFVPKKNYLKKSYGLAWCANPHSITVSTLKIQTILMIQNSNIAVIRGYIYNRATMGSYSEYHCTAFNVRYFIPCYYTCWKTQTEECSFLECRPLRNILANIGKQGCSRKNCDLI